MILAGEVGFGSILLAASRKCTLCCWRAGLLRNHGITWWFMDLWIYISLFWCGLYYLYHFWIVVTTCDLFFSWPTIRFVERVKDKLQEVSKGTSLCLFFADHNSKHHGIILRWPFILESEDEQLVLLLTSTSSCQTTCKFQWIRRDECWWRLPSKAFAAATPAAAWKRAWCKRPL